MFKAEPIRVLYLIHLQDVREDTVTTLGHSYDLGSLDEDKG